MELLGVRRGMVALTKIDLVSPERVREAADEVHAFLRGSFMDGAPVCPVSSETFEGYGEFYDTLVAEIAKAAARPAAGVFRMPVERVFAREGFGTVVTGIPVAGTVRVGDTVEIVPGGQTSKVRGIQRFLRTATEGGAGQCLAINLSERLKVTPERGQVVATAGYLQPAVQFHLALRVVPGLEHPLKNAEPVTFHVGTAEAEGKVFLIGEGNADCEGANGRLEELATLGARATSPALGGRQGPGAASQTNALLATVVLSKPIAAAPGDRVILRRPSPAATVAGGEILASRSLPGSRAEEAGAC